MANTKIEWTDKVWNPITGCSHSGSPGCDNCYAKRMAHRLRGRYGYPQDDPFRVTFHADRLSEPLRWKKPSRIFVVSMGDILHDDVDGFWLSAIWSIMERCYWHTFLILTKRPQRWKKLTPPLPLYKNILFGVSIENQKTADERIPILLRIPAAKRFVSIEPMLDKIELLTRGYLADHEWKNGVPGGLDWVICGGETGTGARPMHPDWPRSLRDQCQAAGVPFFFKSWGEWAWSESAEMKKYKRFEQFKLHRFTDGTCMYRIGKKKAGRRVDGQEWNEFPK